jgi:hypothetical protein
MRTILTILALWFASAALAVRAGLTARIPPPVLVIGLAAIALIATFTVPSLRRRIGAVDTRLFLLPHLVRYVGIAFLLLVNRGVLAPAFVPIGWGDLVAAIGATALLVAGGNALSPSRRWIWLTWNTFGLADMILLIVTGVRLATADPTQFTLFRQLPFGLLPTFFVPLIVATHVIIYIRLLGTKQPASG